MEAGVGGSNTRIVNGAGGTYVVDMSKVRWLRKGGPCERLSLSLAFCDLPNKKATKLQTYSGRVDRARDGFPRSSCSKRRQPKRNTVSATTARMRAIQSRISSEHRDIIVGVEGTRWTHTEAPAHTTHGWWQGSRAGKRECGPL